MVVQSPPPPRGRSGAYWVAAILLFLLFGSVAVNFVLLVVVAATAGEVAEGPERLMEREVEAASGTTSNKIAVIRVEGVITDDAVADFFGGSGKSTVDHVRLHLRKAARDADVKGVVLQIDSPGGGVTASDLIHRELVEFKQKSGKPVVALMMDLAASGGYYVAAPCDAIIAHRTTITGSIGVIMSFFDLTELGGKAGVKEVVIKSGANKDIANPFSEMTAEQRALLQALVDTMYQRFVDVVDEGRANLDRAQVLALADGRIYTGDQAKQNGLVDDLGYFDDAVDEVKSLAKISDARIVTYRGEPTLADVLTGNVRTPGPPTSIELTLPGLDLGRAPRFQYLCRVR